MFREFWYLFYLQWVDLCSTEQWCSATLIVVYLHQQTPELGKLQWTTHRPSSAAEEQNYYLSPLK